MCIRDSVSSDHFIERPEILDLKDLIQPEKAKPETESTTDTEKKEVPKAKEKLPEPARKAA